MASRSNLDLTSIPFPRAPSRTRNTPTHPKGLNGTNDHSSHHQVSLVGPQSPRGPRAPLLSKDFGHDDVNPNPDDFKDLVIFEEKGHFNRQNNEKSHFPHQNNEESHFPHHNNVDHSRSIHFPFLGGYDEKNFIQKPLHQPNGRFSDYRNDGAPQFSEDHIFMGGKYNNIFANGEFDGKSFGTGEFPDTFLPQVVLPSDPQFDGKVYTKEKPQEGLENIHSYQYLEESAEENSHSSLLDDCNVFVKYLPPDLSDTEFYKMFKSFGTIISSKIMVDQGTGKSLGYGFVRYSNSTASQKAIYHMNGHRISNKRLLCKLANLSPSSYNAEFTKHPILNSQTPNDNIYIKPLLKDTSEDDLRKLFSKFGNIIDCKVMIDRNTGLSRQIGFVRFETQEQATVAIEEMNNYKLYPSAPPLTVKFADTKEQKNARKALRQKQSKVDRFSLPPNPNPNFYQQPYFLDNFGYNSGIYALTPPDLPYANFVAPEFDATNFRGYEIFNGTPPIWYDNYETLTEEDREGIDNLYFGNLDLHYPYSPEHSNYMYSESSVSAPLNNNSVGESVNDSTFSLSPIDIH